MTLLKAPKEEEGDRRGRPADLPSDACTSFTADCATVDFAIEHFARQQLRPYLGSSVRGNPAFRLP